MSTTKEKVQKFNQRLNVPSHAGSGKGRYIITGIMLAAIMLILASGRVNASSLTPPILKTNMSAVDLGQFAATLTNTTAASGGIPLYTYQLLEKAPGNIFTLAGVWTPPDSSRIDIISTSSNTVVGYITTGISSPSGVAFSPPDGTYAYVADPGNSTIDIISTSSNTVVGYITTGISSPSGVAFAPDGTYAYVADPGNSTIDIISTSSNTVVGYITTGISSPSGVAFAPDGTYAYVANSIGIDIISTSSNTVVGYITTGISSPSGVAFAPDGTYAYVADPGNSTIDIISTSSNTVVGYITTGISSPSGVAFAPDGTYAYVANSIGIDIISTFSNVVTGPNEISSPSGVAFAPDGTYAYVADPGSSTFTTSLGDCYPIFPNTLCTLYPYLTGTYQFELQVNDGGTNKVTSSPPVSIAVNSLPTISLQPIATEVDVGQEVNFLNRILGGTPPFTYSYSVAPGKNYINGKNGNNVTFISPGTYTINETVTDSVNYSASNTATVVVNPAPTISIIPSNTTLTAGDTETFNITALGGTGPLEAQLYNVTGSANQGSPVLIIPPFQINATAGYLNTESTGLLNDYSLYLCAAGAAQSFVTGSPFSWKNDSSSDYSIGGIASSVGRQNDSNDSDSICSASPDINYSRGVAIAEIGLNESLSPGSYHIYGSNPAMLQHNGGAAFSGSKLSYNVSTNGSFVVILAASGGGDKLTSYNLPPRCTTETFINNTDNSESAYIAICSNQLKSTVLNTYDPEFNFTGGSATFSAAAYVFTSPPIGGSNTISFIVSSPTKSNKITYNAIVKDLAGDVSNSTNSTITVNPATASTSVSCPSFTAGSGTLCTITVTGDSPTGTVSFITSDSTGSFTAPSCTLSSGSCIVGYKDTAAGSPTITATYFGDSNNNAGTSGTTSVTVNPVLNGVGGGAFTGGGVGGGGGSSLPSIIVYLSGNQTGYTITNLTKGNSETLNFNNNTKTIHITINFITPTTVGITANNNTYNLTIGSPVTLVDPNNYTYYAKLMNLSYLPIQHTIALLVYGEPNLQVIPSVAVITTKPIVQKVQPASTTTILPTPTTIAPQPVTTSITLGKPSSGNNNLPLDAGLLVVVIMIVLAIALSFNRKGARRKGGPVKRRSTWPKLSKW